MPTGAAMSNDDRIERARKVYERAVFGGDTLGDLLAAVHRGGEVLSERPGEGGMYIRGRFDEATDWFARARIVIEPRPVA